MYLGSASCLLVAGTLLHGPILSSADEFKYPDLFVTLSNDEKLPYIGLGLGNVNHKDIPVLVNEALADKNNLSYQLFDTARASKNERIISESIAMAMKKKKRKTEKTTIHILTKVWYTHLGYERTKISVNESLKDLTEPLKGLKNVSLRVHVLIHWPQCFTGITWMNCDEEENELPQYVKDAGANPRRSKYSYVASWRALEDMYKENPTIASIGVSNFEADQLDNLLQACRVEPHIYQGNMEMTLAIVNDLIRLKIHPQVYGLFNALTTPHPILKVGVARRHLVTLSNVISDKSNDYAPASVMLAFMVKNRVGVMVRTTKENNLIENSPKSVAKIPALSTTQEDRLKFVLHSLSFHWEEEHEADMEQNLSTKVHVNFHNRADTPVDVFFIGPGNERTQIIEKMESGHSNYISSYPGHTFAMYDTNGREIKRFVVTGGLGSSEWFTNGEL